MANHLPSPIPTGKGVRSAVDEEIFSVYLKNSLHVPYLNLPPESQPRPESQSHSFPARIDYETLVSSSSLSKRYLTNQILKSVYEYGVFRILNHGITIEEIRSLASSIFQNSRSTSNSDEFFLLENENWALRGEMKGVASKLDVIAEEVGRVLSVKVALEMNDEIRDVASILSVHRYSYMSLIGQDRRLLSNENFQGNGHALSLHVPLRHCQFHIKSRKGRHSIFDVGPNTIVVAVRKQLEELSRGEMKCGIGEFIFESNQLHGSLQSFTLEFKCSPSSLNNQSSLHKKTISIHNQLIIALIIVYFYQFCFYLYG